MKAGREGTLLVGVVTFLVVLGSLAALGMYHLEDRRSTEIERLRTAVEALAPRAAELMATPSDEADAQIRAWAAASGLRITLIGADGLVHADSWTLPDLLDRMENHLQRSEVQAALGGETGVSQRRSATTDRPTTYVARLLGSAKRPQGFLRLAAESRPGLSPWGGLLVALAAAGVAAELARRRTAVTHAAVARHLRPWSDLPAGASLEALAAEAIQRLAAERNAVQVELDATRTAIGHLEDGIVLLDRSERVRFANPAATTLLAGELIVGRQLVEAVRIPELLSLVRDVFHTGTIRHTTAVVSGRELLLRGSAFAHPELAVSVVVRDATSQSTLERARRALVADLAHELRTPLTVLGGLAEEMRLSGSADDELLETMERQVRRLAAFAGELEELARIESGQIKLNTREVDVLSVAKAVAADHDRIAEKAGVSVEVGGDSVRITTDPERLGQVLSNLVDNAIRYNRAGGRVRVVVEAGAKDVRVRVDDTGLGIPATDAPLVFQRFFRVRRASGPEEGSGLGLAIVKHLVNALGGSVQLSSREGEGTEVTVALPVGLATG